jgi:hypothetical protein
MKTKLSGFRLRKGNVLVNKKSIAAIVVGVIILLLGISPLLNGVSSVFFERDFSGGPLKSLAGGLALALLGVILIFGRLGLTIDVGRGKVIKWWGLILPFSRREWPLGSFPRVGITANRQTIYKNKHHNRNETYFQVALEGEGDTPPIDLDLFSELHEAKEAANEIARIAGKLVADHVSGGGPAPPEEIDPELKELEKELSSGTN